MKCPKCGYLGFETTDRCRNCQYDFSLAPFPAEPDLTLQGNDRKIESPKDFDLPPIKRQSDTLSSTALDLDRLFGDPVPPSPLAEPPAMTVTDEEPHVADVPVDDLGPSIPLAAEEIPDISMLIEEVEAGVRSQSSTSASHENVESRELIPDSTSETETEATATVEESEPAPVAASDDSALPFDDGPIMAPPAARPPLAVRRSTPDVPRNRPRTTRPVRPVSLDLDAITDPKSSEASRAASDTVASLMEMPSLGARVGAGLIDLLLLIGIDAVVLYLTLRVTGLQNTLEDLLVLPPVPLVGFLAMLGFGYVAAFTVAGGQTIGKMALSLRVIGDDGRPVDAAGGMLRAAGCMLVPITLGLSYLPALFTSDHRALHDRLAGTRVVQE